MSASLKHSLPATLPTARLVLTAPTLAHAPAIAHLCNNPNIHRWMARLPFPYTLEDARFFIETIAPGPTEHCYAVLHADHCIGVIGLHFAAGEWPELGYWLGEPYWGQGFATEAALAVVAAARAAGATALRSRALAANARSRHVLEKAGFVETHAGPEPLGPNAGQPAVFLRLDLAAAAPGGIA